MKTLIWSRLILKTLFSTGGIASPISCLVPTSSQTVRLRAICLISLLLQPKEDLPILIVVDEPEIGLHPYALNVIASLLRAASHHTQVLVSTQSSAFLDSFEPEDIVVVERNGEATEFSRPDAEELEAWLEEYSLGETWEKNVIGGGPH